MTDLVQDDYVPPRDDWMSREGPIYMPQDPRWPGWQKNTNWDWMSKRLRAEGTKVVWVGPNLKWWDLAGNNGGVQGAMMTKELVGVGPAPFEHKLSRGPYKIGATLERTDIKERQVNFGVILNPNQNVRDKHPWTSSFKYRFIEALWWESWSKEKFGYLGFFTRSTGWRWLKCVLASDTNGSFGLDPVAFSNNAAIYDMSVIAVDPYFYKFPFNSTWKADPDKPKEKDGFTTGAITLANKGTVTSSPIYMVSAPGQAQIGDGPDRLIDMPETLTRDKFYMVDTATNARTLTGAVDPVDTPFYRFIRQAGLIDFFLHDIAVQGLPMWRRWDDPQEFEYAVGPKSAVTTRVRHTYPYGEITMILPQIFESAWG